MQEKNESDSFFDLKFEGEIDGVATLVAGPKSCTGGHGETDCLVLVEAPGDGVAACNELNEALGTPQAA